MKRPTLAGISLVALLLGANAAISFADDLPRLNVGPSCDAAVRGAVVAGRDKAACLGDENAALDDLKKNWSKYSSDNKTLCIGTVRSGGPPSYVELLQCLEVMRDAKALESTTALDAGIPDIATPASDAEKPAKKSRRRHEKS